MFETCCVTNGSEVQVTDWDSKQKHSLGGGGWSTKKAYHLNKIWQNMKSDHIKQN